MASGPEPYVADPAEPRPPARHARVRPLLTVVIVLMLLGALAWVVFEGQARQDPALDVPEEPAP